MSGLVLSLHPTWNCTFRHEITCSDMKPLSPTWMTFSGAIRAAKKKFFLTFFHVGEVQFYTFFCELTSSPRHVFALFFAQFISFCTLFCYIFNGICCFCNEFVTKKAFPGVYYQRVTRMWAFHARSHGGLVCEVSLFLLKITLKTALCLCLKTLCTGFLLKITLKQLCACV